MKKTWSVLETQNKLRRGSRTASLNDIISINDLRDKDERGILNEEEKTALSNYESYRIKKLGCAADDEDFHSRYRLLQVLANLSPWQEFLHKKYKV